MRLFFILLLVILASCSSKFKSEPTSSNVEFAEAIHALNTGDTSRAIDLFKVVETNYADEEKSILAQIFLIWVYYQKNDLDNAETTATSFLKFYPYNQYTPWVEYMLGIINYEHLPTFKKDTSQAEDALKLFNHIIQKYPNTEYAKDIEFRMPLVKEILAQKEMSIGRYYLKHKAYIGAIYRFQDIVNNYNQSIYIQEALYRLIYTFLTLGIYKEAENNYKVLYHNYPQDPWTLKANALLKKYTVKS